MTTYRKITEKFEAVSETVNPSGTNLHGSYLDLGTKEDLIFPIVQLLMPFTITELRDRSGASAELLFFFGRPDSFDSNETERAAYIDQMMLLADDFVNVWDETGTLVSRSSQVRFEPIFKLGRDTLTGVGVLFTVEVAGC